MTTSNLSRQVWVLYTKSAIAVICSVVLFSSCDKFSRKHEVFKDCSGVYLLKGGEELKVCNEQILAQYVTGDKIDVTFDELAECFGLIEDANCSVSHGYESLIEVTKIK